MKDWFGVDYKRDEIVTVVINLYGVINKILGERLKDSIEIMEDARKYKVWYIFLIACSWVRHTKFFHGLF